MSKVPRRHSKSKTYHIIFKGIDNQDIFYDNQDRRVFLKHLSITKKEYAYSLYSYSLMDNHVHLVIKIENEFLSKMMHNLLIRYVHYFNKRYKRIGPLVQCRFKSKNIEDQRYFLEVCRYVHRNPENAGFAKTEDYEWSSYQEYVGKQKLVDKNALLHYFDNDIKQFIDYTINADKCKNLQEFAEYEMIDKISDEQVTNIIMQIFDIKDVSEIAVFFKNLTNEEKEKVINRIKLIKGTNKTQVARITRMSRWTLSKVWN